MARLIVNAATRANAQNVLIVSVSGADDGLPRGGLAAEHFTVTAVAVAGSAATAAKAVARVHEETSGVYVLELQGAAEQPDSAPGSSVLAIAVNGSIEGGWADDRGQTIIGGEPAGSA